MRTAARSIPCLIVAACCAAACAAPAAAAGVFPGTYEDVSAKSAVRISVAPSERATLRYQAKTPCGKVSVRVGLGNIADGAFKRRVAAPQKRGLGSIVVKGTVARDARTIGGRLRSTVRGRCGVTRRFRARQGGGGNEAPLGPADLGHYSGSTTEGLPVSFDLVREPGSGRIRVEGFTFDIYAECLDLRDDSGYNELTATVGGLSGGVDSWSDFSLAQIADPDPEYDLDDIDYGVDGHVRNGIAAGDLDLTAGLFDDAGQLSPLGPWQCEEASFEFVEFRASLQR